MPKGETKYNVLLIKVIVGRVFNILTKKVLSIYTLYFVYTLIILHISNISLMYIIYTHVEYINSKCIALVCNSCLRYRRS